jgi:hypothetical protein
MAASIGSDGVLLSVADCMLGFPGSDDPNLHLRRHKLSDELKKEAPASAELALRVGQFSLKNIELLALTRFAKTGAGGEFLVAVSSSEFQISPSTYLHSECYLI